MSHETFNTPWGGKTHWTCHGTAQHRERERGMEQIPPPNARPMKKGFIFPAKNPSRSRKLVSKKSFYYLPSTHAKKAIRNAGYCLSSIYPKLKAAISPSSPHSAPSLLRPSTKTSSIILYSSFFPPNFQLFCTLQVKHEKPGFATGWKLRKEGQVKNRIHKAIKGRQNVTYEAQAESSQSFLFVLTSTGAARPSQEHGWGYILTFL